MIQHMDMIASAAVERSRTLGGQSAKQPVRHQLDPSRLSYPAVFFRVVSCGPVVHNDFVDIIMMVPLHGSVSTYPGQGGGLQLHILLTVRGFREQVRSTEYANTL